MENCYRAIPDSKCSKCQTSYCEVKSHNIKKVNGIAVVYDSLRKKENFEAGNYIARVFVTKFHKATKVTKIWLQVISAETWEMIRYLLPDTLGIDLQMNLVELALHWTGK